MEHFFKPAAPHFIYLSGFGELVLWNYLKPSLVENIMERFTGLIRTPAEKFICFQFELVEISSFCIFFVDVFKLYCTYTEDRQIQFQKIEIQIFHSREAPGLK
jgi:hypothetical protein